MNLFSDVAPGAQMLGREDLAFERPNQTVV